MYALKCIVYARICSNFNISWDNPPKTSLTCMLTCMVKNGLLWNLLSPLLTWQKCCCVFFCLFKQERHPAKIRRINFWGLSVTIFDTARASLLSACRSQVDLSSFDASFLFPTAFWHREFRPADQRDRAASSITPQPCFPSSKTKWRPGVKIEDLDFSCQRKPVLRLLEERETHGRVHSSNVFALFQCCTLYKVRII